jgi:toxin ParE1/3/4
LRRVIWTRPAQRDLEGIRAYIGQFNPLAAQRFAQRLVAAAESLNDSPDRGRLSGRKHRELTTVNPYVIRYRVAPDIVYILRVRHGARRPD